MITFNRDKVIKFIETKSKENLIGRKKWVKLGYSKTQFAKDNELHIGTFISLLNNNNYFVPTTPTLYKIAKGMRCTMEELLIHTKY